MIDLKKVKRISIKDRVSKVSTDKFGKVFGKNLSFLEFFLSLPDILCAKDIKDAAKRIVSAKKDKNIVILGMGAHPIKVGVSPYIIRLVNDGFIDHIALNGASVIHDVEIALFGKTSEDVGKSISKGQFGMVKETADFINEAVKRGAKNDLGLAEAVSKEIGKIETKDVKNSILFACERKNISTSCHIAFGTDIIHFHPNFDPISFAKTSYKDLKRFIEAVSKLEKGVYINLGSAVILPEIFLKAVNIVRNLGFNIREFTTINIDFISQYRAIKNVLERPTEQGGRGINIIGHHEIIFPLLTEAILNLY